MQKRSPEIISNRIFVLVVRALFVHVVIIILDRSIGFWSIFKYNVCSKILYSTSLVSSFWISGMILCARIGYTGCLSTHKCQFVNQSLMSTFDSNLQRCSEFGIL